jgi:CRP-like cAMP-binding protein
LPAAEQEILGRYLEPFTLVAKRVIYDPEQEIEHVYFPDSGMVSLLAVLLDGSGVETASTGRDGMVGMPVFHGTDRIAQQAVVQLPGEARRMTVEQFRTCRSQCSDMNLMLDRYAVSMYMLATQSIACLSKHLIQQRLARWLLHSADQSGSDHLELTQLFMSQMLGVRRSSVTVAAGALRAAKLIQYTRKHVTILDRPALEKKACECYGVIRSTQDRVMLGKNVVSPNAALTVSRDGVSLVTAPKTR